jgi:hypothetical protein
MKPTTLELHYFDLGGSLLLLKSDAGALAREVVSWFAPFEHVPVPRRLPTVYLFDRPYESFARKIPVDLRLAYDGETGKHYLGRGAWVFDFPGISRVYVSVATMTAVCFVDSRGLQEAEMPLHSVMFPAFEILGAQGLYLYHSGAVCMDGHGILIAGPPQVGKSTLTLWLFAHGGAFMDDDRCFVKRDGEGFRLIAFSRPVRVHPSTTFGYLPDQSRPALADGKVSIDIRKMYPERALNTCKLDAIVLPQIGEACITTTRRVEPSEALPRMMALTRGWFLPEPSRLQFEFNCDLVTRLPVIEVILGRNREEWIDNLKIALSDKD